jgi:hypothetical protein
MNQDQIQDFCSILDTRYVFVPCRKWKDSVCREVPTICCGCCFIPAFHNLCTHIAILASSLHLCNIHSSHGAFFMRNSCKRHCWNLIKGLLAPSISPGFYSRTGGGGGGGHLALHAIQSCRCDGYIVFAECLSGSCIFEVMHFFRWSNTFIFKFF